ncbi:MAG: BppU family phage baseplate upper protein [Lachnotalea sp.]
MVVGRLIFDFARHAVEKTIRVKQFDSETRQLLIVLLNDGEAYEMPDEAIVRIECKKTDSEEILNDCTYVENLITAEITEQMTAAAGMVECAISVYTQTSYIASWTFNLKVDTSVILSDKIESTTEYKAIINALQEVETAKDTIEEAVVLASTAMKTANDTIGIAAQVKEEATAAAAASEAAVKIATVAATTAQNYKELIEDIYKNIGQLNDFAEEAWLSKSYLGCGYLGE